MTRESLLTIEPVQTREASALLARTATTQKTHDETIGERLARLRRERGTTQTELAERLGIAQPMISAYERGTIRLHGEVIVELTRILDISADELLGLGEPKAKGSVKNHRLLRQLQQLDKLPRRDQQALFRTIDAFLRKAG